MYRAAISVFAKGEQSEQALCLSEAMQQKRLTQSYVSSRSRFIIITFFFSWIANTLSCIRCSKTHLFLSILHFSQRFYTIRSTNKQQRACSRTFCAFWDAFISFFSVQRGVFCYNLDGFGVFPEGPTFMIVLYQWRKPTLPVLCNFLLDDLRGHVSNEFWAHVRSFERFWEQQVGFVFHTLDLSVRNLIFHTVRV